MKYLKDDQFDKHMYSERHVEEFFFQGSDFYFSYS